MNKLYYAAACILLAVSAFASDTNPLIKMEQEASEALALGDYYTAVSLYKEIIFQNPSYFEARVGISEAYFRLGEYAEADKHIQAALKLDSTSTEAGILYGRILTGEGLPDKADIILGDVIKKEPNNVNAIIASAELSVVRGNLIKALELYDEALSKSPDNRKALLSSILIYDSINESSISGSYVEKALVLYPDNQYVNYISAKHYFENGRIEYAKEFAERAYSLDSSNFENNYLLSRIYIAEKNYNKAADLLKADISRERNRPELWYLLGEVYREIDQFSNSVNSFASAINYSPQDELPRIALENILIRNYPADDPLRSKYADYHFELGKALIERNYVVQARNEIRRGLLIDPFSLQGRKMFAEMVKTQGYLSDYLSLLEELSKDAPEDRDLADELEIYRNIVSDTVSTKWNINQFEIETPKFQVSVFRSKDNHSNPYNEGYHLGSYLINYLHGYENIEARLYEKPVSYSDAFRAARENGSDYFLVFDFRDTLRSFTISAGIYHSGTGTLLKTLTAFRTGNNRISLASQTISRDLSSSLPSRAVIMNRKFNRVLINSGRINGTGEGDVFVVIRDKDVSLSKNDISLEYSSENLLGEVTVTAVDDLVSEGELKKYQFFDLINPGDVLVREKTTESEEKPEPELSSKPFREELYKSILNLP